MRKRIEMKTENNKTLAEGYSEFMRFCKVKNLSEATLVFYESDYNYFIKFVPEKNFLIDITTTTVEEYILYLKENTYINNITINTYLRGLRAFLYYCMKVGYMNKFEITLIKAEKKAKETYSESELKVLLKKPNLKNTSFTDYRNWVIVNFLIATGVRVRTLINIKIGDIDFQSETVKYTVTKNRKQQLVPLSKTLSSVLNEYLLFRKGESDDYLFPNAYGQQLTDRALQKSLAKFNKDRGVNKTSIHLYRHTFAKMWILKHGDILRLQKILGHSSLNMVREYVEMFTDDLQKDFNSFNPLEQMQDNKSFIKMKK